MKQAMTLILGLFLLLASSGCSMEKVEAGYVGVKVNLLGTDKGVDHEEVGVGRYFLSINEELYRYPVFQQNYTWTASADEGSPDDESITFQTTEGLSVNGDFGISYSIVPDSVNTLFATYRRGIDEITDVFLRNMVRDALNQVGGTMEVESVYGSGKTELLERVQILVQDQVQSIGIEIDRIYIIGKLALPDQVFQALNAKVAQTQQAEQRENQLQEQIAQAAIDSVEARAKLIAAEMEAQATLTKAEYQARANQVLARSLTPTLVEWRRLEKWDGQMPQVVGSGATTMLGLK